MWNYRKKEKIRCRILVCLLAFFIVSNTLVVSAAEAPSLISGKMAGPWDGKERRVPKTDEKGTFLITSGAELAWFADQVNQGKTKINASLENDIELNTFNSYHNWVIIGDSLEHPFQGTFDGKGHNIGYLWVEITQEHPEKRYAGVFGVIDGGTVKNLTVGGTVIHGLGTYGGEGAYDELYTASGAIAGYVKSGQVIGCTNYAMTEMEGEIMYRNSGGLVGINSGTILRCTNYGDISTKLGMSQRHVGGIAGMVHGKNASVWYCENRHNIKGYYEVGGIAGAVKNGGEIQSCSNFNKVQGSSILGGIAGNVTGTGTYSDGSKKECLIKNVYSLGEIDGWSKNYSASSTGGIVGVMGYERWTEEALPPLPVVENAYTTVQYSNDLYSNRGSIIGVFRSGVIGNVYGQIYEKLKPCGYEENKATSYSGAVQMKKEETLKSKKFVESELGKPFMKASKKDKDTNGYPKLIWQKNGISLTEQIDDAILELRGWLSEENQKKYGSAYTQIENTVTKYLGQLELVDSEERLNQVMQDAREALGKIKPSQSIDKDLVEAIDNGIITLEEYRDKVMAEHSELTEVQVEELDTLVKDFSEKLEKAKSLEEVKLLVRDGKDALDGKIAEYEEEKRLEEIRANGLKELEGYRAEESFPAEWMEKIAKVREDGLENIRKATTVREVTSHLKKAKEEIDKIIHTIPEEGAWDGTTLEEPRKNEQGVYEIYNGAQLAWFADQVNHHQGMQDINGRLYDNISLGNKSWTPIGAKEVYRGSFDGNGYTVRGLLVDKADSYAGLFGAIYGTDTQSIQNLTVDGQIQCSKTVDYAGGIVAYIYGKNPSIRNAVINCHSDVDITLSKVKKNGASAGGIAGYAKYTWFRQCSNTGDVIIDSVGKGGIRFYTGGLIGNTVSDVSVRQSYNAGFVHAEYCAGGLVGNVGGSNCQITSCYNSGETSASTYSGGLAGVVSAAAGGSSVSWCYSSGPVNLEKSGEYLGALFGGTQSGEYANLYAWKRPDQTGRALVGFSSDATSPGTFLSDIELRGDTVLNSLNAGGSYFIHDYLGFQNDFPILSWQLTLEDLKSGAVTELQNFVSQEDYTEENWALVEALIVQGTERIYNSSTMDEVKAVLTETKEAIYQIESKEEAALKQLEEKKEEALLILEQYVDLSLYREAEQILIQKYLSDAKKLIVYAESIEVVERYLAEAKENIDALPTKEQYEYEQDVKAAEEVDNLIGNIGEVIWADYVKTSINKARVAYDALTESQKALVTLYQVLLDAEEEYDRLAAEHEYTEEDAAMAALVDELIAAIGEVTLDSGDAIKEARYAYDGLSDIQKSLVQHPEILEEAEQKYDELCAAEVVAAIASMGEITTDSLELLQKIQTMYDSLTENQKTFVTNYGKLQEAVVQYENLLAAQSVVEMIAGIGEVTLESKTVITETIEAYNQLTAQQQVLVSNYELLLAAIEKYDSLSAIAYVEQLIGQIGAVSTSSGNAIWLARDSYNRLTPEQQAQVGNLAVLEQAEAAYEALSSQPEEDNPPELEEIPKEQEESDREEIESEENMLSGTVSKGGHSSKKEQKQENKNKDAENKEKSKKEETKEEQKEQKIQWEEGEVKPDKAGAKADMAVKKMETMKKQKKNLKILGVILVALAVVTAGVGVAVKAADKQRKKKEVHY
ncbi:MAG: hypothetical protein KIC52_05560 [Firmicutes bacterium]|nr:hypothetical protein [Bacillota bacterium]